MYLLEDPDAKELLNEWSSVFLYHRTTSVLHTSPRTGSYNTGDYQWFLPLYTSGLALVHGPIVTEDYSESQKEDFPAFQTAFAETQSLFCF